MKNKVIVCPKTNLPCSNKNCNKENSCIKAKIKEND